MTRIELKKIYIKIITASNKHVGFITNDTFLMEKYLGYILNKFKILMSILV